MTAYSVETHPLQMSFIHIGGSQTHAKLGMYGPPPFCKRKVRMTELVCANVFGLDWSSELLA